MLTQKAYALAKNKHMGQLYGTHDYFAYHILAVERDVIDSLGNKATDSHTKHEYDIYSIVAYLHDVVEDTSVTLNEIELLFGTDVCYAVTAITKRKSEKYTDYLSRVYKNEVARRVKYYDILFNLHNTVQCLTQEVNDKNLRRYNKYMQALKYLHF